MEASCLSWIYLAYYRARDIAPFAIFIRFDAVDMGSLSVTRQMIPLEGVQGPAEHEATSG